MRRTAAVVVMWLMLGSVAGAADPRSGLGVGEEIVPFNPIHVAGPHQGTNTCPVCAHLHRPAILVFAKDVREAAALAPRLEAVLAIHDRAEVKGFLVVVAATPEDLKKAAAGWKVKRLAVCCLDPETRVTDLGKHYRIDPTARTTSIIYRDYKVTANLVNVSSDTFSRIESALRATLK